MAKDDVLIKLVPVNNEDNVLHLILGITGVIAYVASRPASRAVAASDLVATVPDLVSDLIGDLRDLVREPREARGPLAAAQARPARGRRRRLPPPRSRPPGGPSCAGRGASGARSPRAPRPRRRARSAAASVTALRVSSTRPERLSGGSIGRSAERSRLSTSPGWLSRH